jgi:hypothetical protein
MRFKRYPRVDKPSPPSSRRVAAAKRSVQAEKDRYPLFPELRTYQTVEERLDAMQEHRITWWQEQRDMQAASWRRARALLRSLPEGPRKGIMLHWQKGVYPGDPVYLLGMIHEHKVRKRCYWHALAEFRRMELVATGRLPRSCMPPPLRLRSIASLARRPKKKNKLKKKNSPSL